jgi:hypothetical protein
MTAFQDLRGLRFERLTVTAFSHFNKSGNAYWSCVCNCKTTKTIVGTSLTKKKGATRSCGCLQRELTSQREHKTLIIHGHTVGHKFSPTYTSWANMMKRCYDPNCPQYKDYGGRWITVCERWHDFINFLADMGTRPAGLVIDRINNDGNYEPGNCRWTTYKVSANNRRERRQDLTGRQFGQWSVIALSGIRSGGAYWLCRCSCGIERAVRGHTLSSGESRRCGRWCRSSP